MKYEEFSFAGITEVYDLLYRLGLTANYTGFFYTAYAVLLAAEQPDRLLRVTKWLYPSVAIHCHTTWAAVERGIRYAIKVIWDAKPQALQEIADFPLSSKPAPARFIAILSNYYSSHKAA